MTPRYGNRAVYIQKSTCRTASSSCRWVTYKKIRTSSKGYWSVKLPAYSRRTHFRGVVKASNNYAKGYSNHYVTTWRY